MAAGENAWKRGRKLSSLCFEIVLADDWGLEARTGV